VEPGNFLEEYAQLATIEDEMGVVATWLFENARRMKEEMFSDLNVDWSSLEPVHILAMRAIAPKGVFTPAGRSGYLMQVKGNSDLTGMAAMLFVDDFGFANHLWPSVRPQILALMRMAYDHGIRTADPRVKSM
jgi:hypothetical protein